MKPTENKSKAEAGVKSSKVLMTGVKKMVQSKFEHEEHPSKIREARIKVKLSQDELADRLDYSHTSYGEIERGRRPVRIETANRIAEVLGSKVDVLFKPQGKKLVAKRA